MIALPLMSTLEARIALFANQCETNKLRQGSCKIPPVQVAFSFASGIEIQSSVTRELVVIALPLMSTSEARIALFANQCDTNRLRQG